MPAKHARKKFPPLSGKKRARGKTPTATPDYDADEFEFIMAMDKYKREQCRPFPLVLGDVDGAEEVGLAETG